MNEVQLKNPNIAGKLAKTFINHPLTMIMGVLILLLGYFALHFTPREENPQIKVSGGAVIVALPGADAAEIQKVIIEPLEKKIKEIKGVEDIYSYAQESVGIVQVRYYIGEDKEESNLKLYDQVMRNMDLLPKGAMQPIVKTMDIDTDIPIATIAFYVKNNAISETELYNVVNRVGKDINALDNVALVDLKGEKKEQYNVLVDSNKLSSYGLSLAQISKAISGLAFETPDIKGRTTNNEMVLFSIKSAIENEDDLKNIVIATKYGSIIYLSNIAKIEKSYDIHNKKEAYIQTKDMFQTSQVTLTISKLKGTNSVVINENIFKYVESLKANLEQKGIGYIITRDDGFTANNAVNSLVMNLLISIGIIFILLIFTLGLKEAIIVSIMVPMILALTLFMGFLLDETINRITLFALLVSLGMLVDAAIIVIENIHRHKSLKENQNKSIEQITIEATNEIGNPTNIATIAIIITFLPMFFVGGMMGQFMYPLPVFVPIALFISLFIAYIFTPYLVKKFLRG